MKKTLLFVSVLLIICFQISWQSGTEPEKTSEMARKWICSEMDLIERNLLQIQTSTSSVEQQKKYFHEARKYYKHVEFFIEYCSPREAKYYINGPLVPKHDPDIGNVPVYPQGFQRIEELLFVNEPSSDTKVLNTEIANLKERITDLKTYYTSIEIEDYQLLEMCQLQLFRIAAMNLSGYDATIMQTNVQEAVWNLEGIETCLNQFELYLNQNKKGQEVHNSIKQKIAASKSFLNKNMDYNTFDRLGFITKEIEPLNKLLVEFHNAISLPWSTTKHALKLEQGSLFRKESYNLQYFSIYYNDTLRLEKQAALGRLLFNDPVLSGNNKLSCANCHNPAKGFTDGLTKSKAIDGKGRTLRNSPTLLNVIYQKAFFHDGRAYQLEQQAADVIHNPIEMNSSLSEVVLKLKKQKKYRKLFAKAFAGTQDSSITEYAIQKVITEYEKTLISFNSRFDQYLRGNTKSLNAREINGYNLFAGKALCGSCHFFPLFNGTVPPFYSDSEFEVIGTPEKSDNKSIDSDEGRKVITKVMEQRYAFKTPTVRNSAVTAPYMHNGVYNKLEEVVEFYHKGGGNGLGFKIPNQTLPFDSLQLNKVEKEDIVLFLKTLTDTSSVKNR